MRAEKYLVKQICQGDYKFPVTKWNSISESAISLVRKLMIVNPKERFSAEEVRKQDCFKICENIALLLLSVFSRTPS